MKKQSLKIEYISNAIDNRVCDNNLPKINWPIDYDNKFPGVNFRMKCSAINEPPQQVGENTQDFNLRMNKHVVIINRHNSARM
ncbi:MAG: hypothetical protein V3U75_13135 [Methylococcaceae bacterium]